MAPNAPLPEYVNVINDYGSFIARSSPTPGTVADASKLPHAKERIKNAIVAALHGPIDAQTKRALKIAYLQLAEWQDGVGDSDEGLDASTLDGSQGPEALIRAVLDRTSGSEKWTALARRDRDALARELMDLGLM